jgi:tRNA(Ile)-lysidine synthase
MYHVAVRELAQRLLDHIRRHELLKAGDRVGVAVSGGIDSVSLLRLLLELRSELGIVLSVVHFNHKLRAAEADADEQFVAELAHVHDLEFHCDSDDVAEHARDEGVSLETAARELRYGFFRYLIEQGASDISEIKTPTSGNDGQKRGTRVLGDFEIPSVRLNKIVTGHTLDDQAETVLMRLIRGAGMRGLGAVHPRIAVEDDEGCPCGEILRPLLATRRSNLEAYLRHIGQAWREDASNEDEKFTRNRIRKLVVPLLERDFNPSVTENLAELAEIARGEEDYWENEVAGWMGTAVHWSQPDWVPKETADGGLVQIVMSSRDDARSSTSNPAATSTLQQRIDGASWLVMNAAVDRRWFLGEPVAVQRRAVKAIGEQAGIALEFKHVEDVLSFAAEEGGKGKQLSLPLGWKLVRQPDQLIFMTPDLREPVEFQDYEYDLSIPGRVVVREAGLTIEASRVPADSDAGYNPEQLLDADSLPGRLRVRNWRAGDRFWPCHTKSPKKIKELLQELHLTQPERELWPVVWSGEEIVWVRGFPSATQFRARPGGPAVQILERPLAGDIEQ